MKLILLLGQRVRSGTNFVGTTLKQHPDVVTIPQETSLGEFNLFRQNVNMETVYNQVVNNSFGLEFNEVDKVNFMESYGTCWLELLKQKYDIPHDKTLFLKSPYIQNIESWKMAFPNSKIAIVMRDGRDNVISSVRGSNDKRAWHSITLSLKKRVNYYSGRSFVNHTLAWRDTARKIITTTSTQNIKVFKYEELNNSKKDIQSLLNFYELKCDDEILKACLNAPVVGSSFGVNTGTEKKPNWTPNKDKSNFQFSNKWKSWKFFKKMVFKILANDELIELGYESNTKW